MTFFPLKKVGLACAAAALLALAGCGGDDDDTPSTPAVTAQVPASASASVDGFISYLMALVVAPADDLEPVDITAVTPPTSENTEPTPLP